MPKNQAKERESLADWARRTTPDIPSKPSGRKSAGLSPEQVAKQPRYVPLRVWAQLLLGDHAPHDNTLLRWVHDGRIQPQPKKIGRKWFVRPDAEYCPD